MEFIPAPAVHRILCADCGRSRFLADKTVHLSHAVQEIQLFQIPQTYASIVLGIRKFLLLFCQSLLTIQCPSVDITEGIPKQGVYIRPPWRLRFLTVGLLHSICVVLPKLRALPCTPGPMDDCTAGVSRAPCHLPQETQRLESGTAHGRALYLDGTPLKASESVIDHTKGG